MLVLRLLKEFTHSNHLEGLVLRKGITGGARATTQRARFRGRDPEISLGPRLMTELDSMVTNTLLKERLLDTSSRLNLARIRTKKVGQVRRSSTRQRLPTL